MDYVKVLPYDTPDNNRANVMILAKLVGIPERILPMDQDLNAVAQVLAGVILYRHLQTQEQRQVMRLVESYSTSNREFYGALMRTVGSILADPHKDKWSLSNSDLEDLIWYHSKFSRVTTVTGILSSPGIFGVAKDAWNVIASSGGNVIGLAAAVISFGLGEVSTKVIDDCTNELSSRQLVVDKNSSFPGK